MKTSPRWLRRLAIAVVASVALSSCALGTDGIVVTSASEDNSSYLPYIGDEFEVELPHIPIIALPDISNLREYDALLQDRLGGLELQPIDGVEVVTAECESGDVVLRGNESSDVFESSELNDGSFTFEIDQTTGASSYFRTAGGVRTSVMTNVDGSGIFVEEGVRHRFSIETSANGAGRVYANNDGIVTTVEADAAGAGVYYDLNEEVLTTITIGSDGSGALFNESPDHLLTVDARQDGTGDLFRQMGDRTITLRVRSDDTWELVDESPEESLTVKVFADGSGQYRQRGTGVSISLDFDADGATVYGDAPGPQIIIPEAPKFAVASRFPALGTLAAISPPCATVLRFDSQVLFEVNEHEVLPEAIEVLTEVAPALIEADRTLEINGHTDSTGTEEYNQALSERRAQAVADVLRSLGVDVELTINGFGESQPVAENYNEDGTDNEAGQRQNRRVEIVIHG